MRDRGYTCTATAARGDAERRQAMISHVFIGTNDQDRAPRFYASVMDALGWRRRVSVTTRHLSLWQRPETMRPLCVVGRPFDGNRAQPGNGPMVALMTLD